MARATATGDRGFTLVEMLLVLLLVALLAGLAAPVVNGGIQRAREAALRENLHQLRKAIDDHFADRGEYPASLEELVTQRYLRRIPIDPFTERSDTWIAVPDEAGRLIDVRSGAPDHEEKDHSQW